MKPLAFAALVAVFVAASFFAGRLANTQDGSRLAEQEYYRGIFSVCAGLLAPVDACNDLISRAYAENFWAQPDPGFIFPPLAKGTSD